MQDFEFQCAGLSDKNQLIFLVDDYQHGKCSYAIKETVVEDGIDVEVDFLHETDKEVPDDRQKEIVAAIILSIIETSTEEDAEIVETV